MDETTEAKSLLLRVVVRKVAERVACAAPFRVGLYGRGRAVINRRSEGVASFGVFWSFDQKVQNLP